MKRSCQKGFLLVDSLVAVMIVTLAFVAISGVYIANSRRMQVSDDRSIAYLLAQERLEQLQFRNQTFPNQPSTEVDIATGKMWKEVVPITTTTYTSMETLLTNNTTDSIILGAFRDTNTSKTVTNMRDNKVVNRTFTRSTMVKINSNNTLLVQIKVIVSWVDNVGNTRNVEMLTYYNREK